MIRTIPIVMFAAVILNASSGCLRSAPQLIPSSTQGTDAPSQASPDVARMEQVVQSYVSNKQFMGSVLVAHGDDILFNKGYGYSGSRWLAIPFLATLSFATPCRFIPTTPDKPEVLLETPPDLNRMNSFLNLRVVDIWDLTNDDESPKQS